MIHFFASLGALVCFFIWECVIPPAARGLIFKAWSYVYRMSYGPRSYDQNPRFPVEPFTLTPASVIKRRDLISKHLCDQRSKWFFISNGDQTLNSHLSSEKASEIFMSAFRWGFFISVTSGSTKVSRSGNPQSQSKADLFFFVSQPFCLLVVKRDITY